MNAPFASLARDLQVPAGWRPFTMQGEGFLGHNGPLWLKIEGERLALGMRVEERHCNPGMICHGGMMSTFADMYLALGANYEASLARMLPTITLNTDFLAPAPLGCWLEGRGEILRRTRRMVFVQGLSTVDGAPVARSSGVFKIGEAADPATFDIRARLAGEDHQTLR